MLDLKIKANLQQLVDEGLEESLTLDYKDSRALPRDGKGVFRHGIRTPFSG
jgi:hypothetical protein